LPARAVLTLVRQLTALLQAVAQALVVAAAASAQRSAALPQAPALRLQSSLPNLSPSSPYGKLWRVASVYSAASCAAASVERRFRRE